MNAVNSFQSALGTLWANVAAFFPKFLLFLVILVVGYFVSKWVAKLVEAVLRKVGVERLFERGGVNKTLSRSPYPALDLVRKLVFFSLFLLVLQLAFSSFGPNPVSDILTTAILFLPRIFVALVIVIVAAVLAKMVRDIVAAALGGVSLGGLVANATATAIIIVGVFAAISHLQIAPAIVNGLFYAALAVVAGSAIVAIGGGGIAPMRRQWEKVMERLEQEPIKPAAPAAEEVTEVPLVETKLSGGRPVHYEPRDPGRAE